MEVTILGSGTLVPDHSRHSASHWVEDGDVRLLLDCGAGTVHGMDRHGVPWPAISHLALSHFHVDHAGDVAALLFALKHGLRPPREQPLTLLGPPGTGRFLERLTEAFFGYIADPSFPLEVRELPREGGWSDPGGRFHLAVAPTPHTERSVAYRYEGSDGVVGYTGDTGPSTAVGRFLSGCAVLLAECSLPDPPEIDTHLTPAGLAELAGVARPGLLVATHLYPPLDPADLPHRIRQAGYEGTVVVGRDGMRVGIRDNRPGPVRDGGTSP